MQLATKSEFKIGLSDIPKCVVVIPAYRCKRHILDVIRKLPEFIYKIIVVDDSCPEQTGKFVIENSNDLRVVVEFRATNGGVGAAMKTGYRKALKFDADIVIKMDGDDQMDSRYLNDLISPIADDRADYTKGNRFYNPKTIQKMPKVRIFGNAVLSFFNKISTGYYTIFDPNNGYLAISGKTLAGIELEKLADRFFFESDFLFRLNLIQARVRDIPMPPIYNEEKSNLNEFKIIPTFLMGHVRNFFKRIIYTYFLRDFSVGSVYLITSLVLLFFGVSWSSYQWYHYSQINVAAPTGTIMIGVLPIVIGFQLWISFLAYDISQEPK